MFSFIYYVIMTCGALWCTISIGKEIWAARGCFREVYEQIKEELKNEKI